MNIIDQASAFMEKAKGMSREALQEALKLLPKTVQDAYWEMRKAAYFVPENEVEGSRKEILSPSGKYKLVVSRFNTGPGSWNYSQGVVYRKDDDRPIATIQRNYGAFPNLFVEGHSHGDFLVCGRDYQGQTVVELDTGKRRDLMSDGSDKGWGFCWAAYTYNAPNQILVVDGCHWACPYEHRFYDFSDPMSGWPEIETGMGIDSDSKKEPELGPDGTLRCFSTRYTDDDDEDETDEDAAKKPHAPIVDVVQTFRREGLKFVLTEEWVSDYEKDRRVKRAEAEKRYEQEIADFKATDPLYLAYAELVKDPTLSPDSHCGIGQVYDGWLKGYEGAACLGERRYCRRIITHKGRIGWTVDLEWATKTGPIKLVIFKDGNTHSNKFFEHSAAAMTEAFTYAKAVCR